jgi:hypothetical protein
MSQVAPGERNVVSRPASVRRDSRSVYASIVLTADTYTSVLTDLLAYAAEATAILVLAAAAHNPGHRHRRNGPPAKSAGPREAESSERPVTRRSDRRKGSKRGRPHTSHRRPTKIKGA